MLSPCQSWCTFDIQYLEFGCMDLGWCGVLGPFCCGSRFTGCALPPHPACTDSTFMAAPNSKPTLRVLHRSKSYCVQWGLHPKCARIAAQGLLPHRAGFPMHGSGPTDFQLRPGYAGTNTVAGTRHNLLWRPRFKAAGNTAKGQILLKPHSKQLLGPQPVRVWLSQGSCLCTQTHTGTHPYLGCTDESSPEPNNATNHEPYPPHRPSWDLGPFCGRSWLERPAEFSDCSHGEGGSLHLGRGGGLPCTLQGRPLEILSGTTPCRISLVWLIKEMCVWAI